MEDPALLPLRGIVVCCTGIPPEQRSHIAAVVSQMGARHIFDFTHDVTHLIVENTETAKYKFVAKARPDVKCLLPSWINAVRDSWMAGGETDVRALEDEHKLPALYGLKICITGFFEQQRQDLERAITAHGGEYRPNLTRAETHLIATEAKGAKYDFALRWGIKIVATEWLDHSIERGLALEETTFALSIPAPERGVGAWKRVASSLGKHRMNTDKDKSRKLRRTTSAKFEKQNSGLWDDIVPAAVAVAAAPTPQLDLIAQEGVEAAAPTAQESARQAGARTRQAGDVFSRRTFLIHGFDERKSQILKPHLVSRGATLLKQEDVNDDTLLVVPHALLLSNIPLELAHLETVNENWVEKCASVKTYIDPGSNVVFQPFQEYPIRGFEALKISTTGFQGIDKVHISKAIRLMGASYDESFDKTVSVLICESKDASKEKLAHSHLWNTPVVRADWLWESIAFATLNSFTPYLVQPYDPVASGQQYPIKTIHLHDNGDSRGSGPANITTKIQSVGKYSIHQSNGEKSSKYSTRGDPIPSPPEPQILQEISPNRSPTRESKPREQKSDSTTNSSSPKSKLAQACPSKTDSTATTTATNSASYGQLPHAEALGPAITSLLKQQRELSSSRRQVYQDRERTDSPIDQQKNSNCSTGLTEARRPRRQLLGRALSNPGRGLLTSKNGVHHSLSRASSIDTINTDGVGTPVLISANTSMDQDGKLQCQHDDNSTSGVIYDTAVLLEQQKMQQLEEQQMQMTQLGYEDDRVKMYRENFRKNAVPSKGIRGHASAGATDGPGQSRMRTRLSKG